MRDTVLFKFKNYFEWLLSSNLILGGDNGVVNMSYLACMSEKAGGSRLNRGNEPFDRLRGLSFNP
jgi:hypothetical protein